MDPIERAVERAASDRRHGATAIEQRLLEDLLAVRDSWSAEALGEAATRLLDGQPAMANLRRLAAELATADPAAVEQRLRSRADVLGELDERLAASAWPAIDGARRLLTLSRSSAVAAVLAGAWRRGWRGGVVVFDGSPEGRGPDQASELAGTMAGVVSRPDAAMALELDGDGLRIVVGADAVGRRRFVNVCGTAMLLELAAARKVPTVVVADTGKDLPEDEIDEVLAALPRAGEPGSGRSWPLFEAVPLELVSERVSE